LSAYRARGRRFLDGITGRFALAVVDEARGEALLAVDRMGIERLAYGLSGGTLVFGTSAEAVARCPGIDASLRPQALFDFLLLHMIPAPSTVFAGVSKLCAGTCARFAQGRLTVERYWQPGFESGPGASFEELRDGLLGGLREAV